MNCAFVRNKDLHVGLMLVSCFTALIVTVLERIATLPQTL